MHTPDTSVQTGKSVDKAEKKPISMHENVEVWQDCCCCEAEPYWIEVMEQFDKERSATKQD